MKRRRSRPAGGFTILEIMVVLAIIGLIAAAVGKTVMHALADGRQRTATLLVREVMGAAQQAMLNDATCPTLDDLLKNQALRDAPKDPWGTVVVLRCPSEHQKDSVDVISAGPDRKLDTPDDINSWQI
jgi:general secretion pathway protein G